MDYEVIMKFLYELYDEIDSVEKDINKLLMEHKLGSRVEVNTRSSKLKFTIRGDREVYVKWELGGECDAMYVSNPTTDGSEPEQMSDWIVRVVRNLYIRHIGDRNFNRELKFWESEKSKLGSQPSMVNDFWKIENSADEEVKKDTGKVTFRESSIFDELWM